MAAPSAPPAHVLALNHDADVLALYRASLERAGYRVTVQPFPARSVEQIALLQPDLIILDLLKEDAATGWRFLALLGRDPRTAAIPVVLCTAAEAETTAHQSRLDRSGVRVVLKPFHVAQLLSAVAAGLATGATPQESQP